MKLVIGNRSVIYHDLYLRTGKDHFYFGSEEAFHGVGVIGIEIKEWIDY